MYISVNGARLFFDVDGEAFTPDGPSMREKPTIIMVHGGPGADHTVFKPYFSQLTDIAQVVHYDHRGNGRSALCTSDTWTLKQWGADLKGLCDALGIEKPVVIGTSFGGFVALSYATQFPDHPGALALISTAAKVEFSSIYAAFGRLGGKDVQTVAESYWEAPSDAGRERYKKDCVPLYSVTKRGSSDWLSRILWRNETALWFNGPRNEHGRFDFRSKLHMITCPTLVMVGDSDLITPMEFSETIVDGLKSAPVTFRKYADCGHGVVGDKPKEALEALRDFILKATHQRLG